MAPDAFNEPLRCDCGTHMAVATSGLSVLGVGWIMEPRSLKRMGCMLVVSCSDMSSCAGNGLTLWKSTLDTRAHASSSSGSSSSLFPCNLSDTQSHFLSFHSVGSHGSKAEAISHACECAQQ